MTNSRSKGAEGERELARELARVLGCRARRGQQYSGSPDSPDVVTDIPGIHIECKRVEHLRLYDALAQARRDAGSDEVPLVIHRRNRGKWIVIVELEDLTRLADRLQAFRATNGSQRLAETTTGRIASRGSRP